MQTQGCVSIEYSTHFINKPRSTCCAKSKKATRLKVAFLSFPLSVKCCLDQFDQSLVVLHARLQLQKRLDVYKLRVTQQSLSMS